MRCAITLFILTGGSLLAGRSGLGALALFLTKPLTSLTHPQHNPLPDSLQQSRGLSDERPKRAQKLVGLNETAVHVFKGDPVFALVSGSS